MTLATMRVKLSGAIQDGDQLLTLANRDAALQEAVRVYAKYRPLELIADVAGNDGYDYDLPTDFDHVKSSLLLVEFPAGARDAQFLLSGGWTLYRVSSTSTKLRFLSVTPATGETARLTYTSPHVVSDAACTVPVGDQDAVVNKAASLCCVWLAAHYSQQGESTLSAEAANHQSKATHYRNQAKLFDQLFNTFLGLGDDVPVDGAATTVAMGPTSYPWGELRLTHRRHAHGA